MSEALKVFKKFFRESLLALPDVQTCAGDRVFNTFVVDKAAMPYGVFQIVPLNDAVGQAKQSSGKRFLVNLKFVVTLPVPDTVYAAIEAAETFFRISNTFYYDGFSISIRHERPIEYPETGITPGEKLLNMGSTYRVWMTSLPS